VSIQYPYPKPQEGAAEPATEPSEPVGSGSMQNGSERVQRDAEATLLFTHLLLPASSHPSGTPRVLFPFSFH
jgi:hypothetical protein